MAEAIVEKDTCGKCGADVREGTQFCYSCGNPLAGTETKAALEDLTEKLKGDDDASADKMAKAAAERKQARVSQRRPKEVVWEPQEDVSGRLILLIALLIAVFAAAAVFVTVYWK